MKHKATLPLSLWAWLLSGMAVVVFLGFEFWTASHPPPKTNQARPAANRPALSPSEGQPSAFFSRKPGRQRTQSPWEAPLRRALAEPDAGDRARLWRELADTVAGTGGDSFARALVLAETIREPGLRREFTLALYTRWAESDPAAAMRHAPGRSEAAPSVLRVWAARDLAGALGWLEEQPAGPVPRAVQEILSEALLEREPRAVLAWMEQSRSDTVRRELYGPFLGKWAESDPAAAAEAALVSSAPNPLNALLGDQLMAQWARHSPVEAATWVAGLAPGELQERAVLRVVASWSATAPAQAAEWVEQFSEGPLREQAARELVTAWTERDATGTMAWLRELASGRSRDVAVSSFCQLIAPRQPETAFRWGETIQDAELQIHFLQSLRIGQ